MRDRQIDKQEMDGWMLWMDGWIGQTERQMLSYEDRQIDNIEIDVVS